MAKIIANNEKTLSVPVFPSNDTTNQHFYAYIFTVSVVNTI